MLEDIDAIETKEWLDALGSVVRHGGKERATYILKQLSESAADHGIDQPSAITTPYRNTISPSAEVTSPGDRALERKIRSIVRWNAMAMVMKANSNDDAFGGDVASFSSAGSLAGVRFNDVFRGNECGRRV